MKSILTKTKMVAIVAIAIFGVLCTGSAKAQDANDPNNENLFDPNRILTFNITMDPGDWDELRLLCPDGICPLPHSYYEASLECGTVEPMLIGIRRKNDMGEPTDANPQKVSLKIDINYFVPGQLFAGKKKFSLECGSDQALVSEGLAWNIYNAAGFTCGRSAWIKVYVNGDYKGLYSNVEQVDKRMLLDLGLDDGGFLYKHTEFEGEVQRTREDETSPFMFNWYPFDHPDYMVETIPPPVDWLDQTLWRVNIPHFLTLAAAENFIGNKDAAIQKDTNFWYYDWSILPGDDPAGQQPRLYFPWDLDTTLRDPDITRDILHPGDGGHLWQGPIEELDEAGTPFGYSTFQTDYLNTYRNLLNGPLELSKMLALVNNLETLLVDEIDADPYTTLTEGGEVPASEEFDRIRDFLTARTASVAAQLAVLIPPPGTVLLDDGFEDTVWDSNWNDISHNWLEDTSTYKSGSASAWAKQGNAGYFTCDALDTSDANAIYVRFWIQKDNIDAGEFELYYYNGTSYVYITDLDTLGDDDEWLYYSDTITDSQYFVSDFQIRFDAAPSDNKENVWVDDVLITKTVPSVTYTITASADPNGTIDPNGAIVKNAGEDQLFTATPNASYEVDTWYLDSNSVQTGGSTYTLYNIQADHTVYVTFKESVVQFTVTATSDANGTIDPAGAVVVDYDDSQLFTASANLGYEVDTWYLDGGSIQTGGGTYTLNNITANHTVNVTFKQLQYTVTATSDANGTIDPAGAVVVDYDDSQLFTASANLGYEVDTWYLDGGSIQTGGGTYTLSNITANHTVNVTFKQLQYTVTATSDANGTIDPAGAVVVDYDDSQLFTASANLGYEVDTWYLDGGSIQTGGGTYTLSNITANHTVNVTFKQLQYTVTATSDANGTIDPAGAVVVDYDDSQLFTASANLGYEVDTWYLDGGNIQTGGGTYTLSNITANHTVNVTFKQLQYTVTATSDANGTIDPAGAVVVDYDDSQLFTASANLGYEVDTWYLDGGSIQTGGGTYTLSNITANHTVNVTFKQLQYTVTATSDANGTIDPAGAVVVDYDDSQLFTASANLGYEVDTWYLDGGSIQTGGGTYTLSNITANHTVNVTFKQLQYTVTATSDANGTIDPAGAVVVDYDDSQLFTASANLGYEVDTWYLDGGSIQTGGGTYTLSNITANHTVNVTFKQLQYTVTATSDANGTIDPAGAVVVDYDDSQLFTASANLGYEVDTWYLDGGSIQTGGGTYTLNNITANHTVNVTFKQLQYTVTATSDANGTIDPAGAVVVDYDDSQLFTASANLGYEVDTWYLDGGSIQTGGGTYTLSNITANHTVNVTFKQLQYTVTATSDANGTIDPAGAVVVDYDDSQLFTASANLGYEVDTWYLDGGSIQTGGGTYTLSNITANHTVNVTFKQLQYTVTATSDANGTIDPAGAVVVDYDDSQLFTASANLGYEVDTWYLDGGNIQTGGGTYTLSNITANHTVNVTFKQLQYTVTATSDANGTIDPAGAVVVDYDDSQLFTASANLGYEVDTWYLDGGSIQTGGGTYTLSNITANHTVNVTFKQLQYTVTATSDANGTIDPAGAVVVDYDDSQLFTASANLGYEVDTWYLDGGSIQTGGGTYTLSNITANHTVNVTFKQLQYTVTATSDANGTIDPAGAVVVDYDDSQLFTASANLGYEVDTWYLDGGSIQTGGSTYTLSNITANHTVNVTFKQLQYTVTATSDANGTIDPAGAVVVDYDDSQIFTASANLGYEVDTWYLDGGNIQTGGGTYTLSNITANHTVNVTYKQLQYTVTATSDANGTIDPAGAVVVDYDDSQLFTASANLGYEVDTWYLDGGNIQTGGGTYTLSNITANHTVNVTFKQLQYTVTATSDANGTIDPAGAVVVDYDDSQLFTASANLGYEVDTWYLDGGNIQTGGGTYTLSNITANHTVNVTFKQLQYTVTATSDANGTIDPAGAVVVDYDDSQLFTASANLGYEVDTWYLDGGSIQTGGGTYTLSNITANHTVNVTFKQLQYTVTATSDANGTIDPAGAVVVDYDDSQLFTASANLGYEVDTWYLDGGNIQTGGGTYTLSNITANHTVNVTFKQLQYTVTATSDANGTIDPAGAVVVDYDDSQLFTASANLGYEVDTWYLDGGSIQTGGGTYTLNNITANHTVNVTFKQLQYTVTATSDANGTIDPAGAVVVDYDDSQLFTASANLGYEVDTWYLDGGSIQTGGGTYTLSNITANHTVNVTFKQLQYTVTATSDANGTIDPAGAVVVDYDDSQLFTASANLGYEVDTWYLDGGNIQTGGGTYTLSNITANHTVNVTFKQLQYTVTATSDANGTIDPAGAVVVDYDDSQLFTASANLGYEVDTWYLDGGSIQTGGGTYTLSNITANHTVNVTFKQLQFTVTATSDANGTIDPAGAVVVDYDDSQIFTASANLGYEVDTWYLDGGNIQTGGGTYTLSNITANHTVNVTFKQLQYTVTATSDANGTIDPAGAVVVDYDDSQIFTASANLGYEVDTWYLDGGSIQTGGGTYTLSNITANHTVNVTFKQLQYTVTATSDANGTIDPAGAVVVDYDDSQLFTASANLGYEVDTWYLDGGNIQTGGGTYTLSNITANHTVNVTFKQLQYTVTATSDANGTIDPAGAVVVDYDDSQLFTASANLGYEVDTWYLDGGNIQTGGGTYTLSNITANHTVNVTFKQLQYTVTATSDANGTIDPAGAVVVDYDDSQLFTASANLGYEVDTWYLDGGSIQTGGGTYTLSNITANHTVNVTFKQLQFTVTATSDANGTIDPAGAVVVDYDDSQIFTASANLGYEVDTWYLDGGNIQTGGGTYTLSNITANHTVNVTFKQLQYTVTATSDANGTIDPAGAVVVDYDDSQIFTASANLGYEVDTWYLDGGNIQTGGGTYTLSNITANHTVNVTFKQLQYTVTATSDANGTIDPAGAVVVDYDDSQIFTASANLGYEVDTWYLDGGNIQTGGGTYTLSNITANHTVNVTFKQLQFTVTATSDANGTIDPAGAVVVDYDDSQLFTASANLGYEVDTWYLDGGSIQTGGGTYTLNNITANHTVNVTFKQLQYTVTATSDANGTIDPAGAVVVDYDDSQIFTASANLGYEVDTWYLDGGSIQTGGGTYTLSNITANHTVNVTFKQLQYTVTATSDANGTIDPAGAVVVDYDDSQLFTASANLGYEVDTWYLDGGNIQTGGGTYTLSNITANHTVNVTFKQLQYTVTATSDANGTIDPAGAVVVDYDDSQIFTASANLGYEVDTWYLDGGNIQTGGGTYTLSNITANHTVNVTFKQLLLLPSDNFDDNKRGAMWQQFEDDLENTWLVEDANRLNVRSIGAVDLVSSCVGHWKMNDDTDNTTVMDSSGKENDGTAQQNTSILHTDSGNPPDLNGALTFNGSSDYITTPMTNFPSGAEARSVSLWIKWDGSSSYNVIFGYGKNVSAQAFGAFLASTGRLYFWDYGTNWDTTINITAGEWTHIVLTYDGTNLTAYKGGAFVNTTTKALDTVLNASAIGRNVWTGSHHFTGSIDNVMLFDKALTAEQIGILYNEGSGTETIPGGVGNQYANYVANGWRFDLNENFEVKVDFHYSDTSDQNGWVGMNAANDESYVSISAGSDGNQPYFYYETVIDTLHTDCVGHWKMNDDTDNTTVMDSSGKENDGTAQQNTSILHTDSGNPPDLNGALTFNGSSDYITTPMTNFPSGAEARSVSLWIKWDGSSSYNVIFGYGKNVSAQAFGAFLASTGRLYFWDYGTNWDTTINITAGEWTHIVLTYDGTNLTAYKGGAFVNTTTKALDTVLNASAIGRNVWTGSHHFTGSIDNVMLFDKVLTAEQIGILYNEGSGTETSPGIQQFVEREVRDSNDGTLYISYDADSNSVYLSHTGYGSENAYVWQTTPDPVQGQTLDVAIGGGSNGAVIGDGEGYLDNFEVTAGVLFGWPLPGADINDDGFIDWLDVEIMCGNWLGTGPEGDLNNDGIVNFLDFAQFALFW